MKNLLADNSILIIKERRIRDDQRLVIIGRIMQKLEYVVNDCVNQYSYASHTFSYPLTTKLWVCLA